MLGIFGKKSRDASKLPETLHFKGNEHAFEYACNFFGCNIKERQALMAIVLDPEKEDATLRLMLHSISKGENKYIAYAMKITSNDGGFKALGMCYNKNADLNYGDLVYWVPMQRFPVFAMMAMDDRAAWMGAIVAKVAPCYSLNSGSFEIVDKFA